MACQASVVRTIFIALSLLFTATPAMAQVRIVPDQPESAASAANGVDVFVMNEGAQTVTTDLPTRLKVTGQDGSAMTLYRVGDAQATVAAGGFVKWRYRNVDPAAVATAKALGKADGAAPQVIADAQGAPAAVDAPVLADSGSDAGVADGDKVTGGAPVLAQSPPAPSPPPSDGEQVIATSTGIHSGLFDRFEPYEPIYGVAGANGAGAKLQFSFAFRPFEHAGVLNGLRFAYTQTFLWAIDQPSGPINSNDYSPEIYYELPASRSVTAALGYKHLSNGGGLTDSADMNRIFARASWRIALGNDWEATISPQAWVYVGEDGGADDLDRYWGYTSLMLSVGQLDGLKVSGMLRGNPGTGKGAGELFISYPLTRLGGLGIYAFGQGFTGYGETIGDYRRRSSYARFGIAFTR